MIQIAHEEIKPHEPTLGAETARSVFLWTCDL
jgi:hypothetical protein